MTTPILKTKLFIPPLRPRLLSRPRLIQRLDAGLRGELTLIAAPAGFGKTTLLSAWGGFRRRVYTALTDLILQGLATIVVGLAPAGAFWLAVGWGIGGGMNVFYNGPLFAFLQATVQPEMQGRVFTVQQSLVWIA